MIHYISVKNFRSIDQEVILDLRVDGNAPMNTKYSDVLHARVSKASVLIGPNSSGKTTVLKALECIRYLFVDSLVDSKPYSMLYRPHATDNLKAKKPTIFKIEFGDEEVVYTYSIELYRNRITYENLSVKSISSIRATSKKLFIRKWNSSAENYSVETHSGIKSALITNIPSENYPKASIVSLAAFLGDDAAKTAVQYWKDVKTNLSFIPKFIFYGHEAEATLRHMNENEGTELFNTVKSYLPMISNYNHSEQTFLQEKNGKKYNIDVDELSSGSQQLLVVLEKLNFVLRNGGVAVIDEFDAYLHPTWLTDLITQFFNSNKNPKNAQLIMSTHSIQIINQLDKYQINIVENETGSTEITRLDQIEGVRSVEDFFGNYMSGKYGGIANTP